jgi:hypothetical protein
MLSAQIAGVLIALGEPDQAIQWFQRAYRQHNFELAWIGISPLVVPLRGDARVQELVRRIGLPPSVTASWNLSSHGQNSDVASIH